MLARGLSIFTRATPNQIAVSVISGLLVSLLVIGVQFCDRSLEKRDQKREAKEYISEMKQWVLDQSEINKLVKMAQEARKTDENFPVPTPEQIILVRLDYALNNLELYLATRTTLISNEDRFALFEPIIGARNKVNLLLDNRERCETVSQFLNCLPSESRTSCTTSCTIPGGVVAVTDVATDFFATLRQSVDWLGD